MREQPRNSCRFGVLPTAAPSPVSGGSSSSSSSSRVYILESDELALEKAYISSLPVGSPQRMARVVIAGEKEVCRGQSYRPHLSPIFAVFLVLQICLFWIHAMRECVPLMELGDSTLLTALVETRYNGETCAGMLALLLIFFTSNTGDYHCYAFRRKGPT